MANQATANKTAIPARTIATCALSIALMVVSCFFTIPLGPVPFTLQTLVIILIALLFEPKQTAIIIDIYLLMGIAGLPVCSGMTGGIGKILGPTGGFLISWFISTPLASALRGMLEKRGTKQIICDAVAALTIIVIADVLGWLWLMVLTQSDPVAAFLMADAPFIVIDCCKAVAAVVIAAAIRKGLQAAH